MKLYLCKMYLLAPFILQNFKKIIGANPELWECATFGPKMAHLSWTGFFLVQTIIIAFIYLLALFDRAEFIKFLQRIKSYEDAPFLGPKWSMCPKQLFFKKIINIMLIYILAPFIVKNLENSCGRSRVFQKIC